MSSGRARDVRYGRRGGGWIDEPRQPTNQAPAQPPAENQPTARPDQGALFGPTAEPGPVVSKVSDRSQREPRRLVLDPEALFAPETIAAQRAHAAQCRGHHGDAEPCPAVVDPGDLAAVRAGRARMARARRAAGVELDAGDRAALAALDGRDDEQGTGR